MRHLRSDRLFSGCALAVLLSTTAVAAPRDYVNEQAPVRRNVGATQATAPQPIVRRESGSTIISIPRRATQAQAQALPEDAPPAHNSRPFAPAATTQAPAAVAPLPPELTESRPSLDRVIAISDTQVAEKIRAAKFDQRISHAPDRKAIEAAYAADGYKPMWFRDGAPTARGKAVMDRLRNAESDGFIVADYSVPDLRKLTTPEAIADGDIRLTVSVMTYARHLENGRIAPTRVTAEADYGSGALPTNPAEMMKRISTAQNINAVLDSYNPQHPGFRALKAKLAEMRARAASDTTVYIPNGGFVRPGQKDARIPAIREKLGVPGKPGDDTYDAKLAQAVKALQKRYDLQASGVIGNATIAKINGPKAGEQLLAVLGSLERWRWLPRDLGRNYVMINIPDYTLRVMQGGNLAWKTNIVVGKPQTPTPLLTASMEQVLVNPSWYVPQSIIQNELLPAYEKDPNIFNRMGLEVRKGPDGHINVVQPPGAANALGHIKFAFPNKYQVYLHDTPEKRLFASSERAFSHGCMRVENPTKFGEVILSLAMSGPTPSQRQLDAMYGQEEKAFKLANRPMVHLTYQTAYVDDAGKLVVRNDIYGYDTRIQAILTTDERKIAEVPPPQDKQRDLATTKSNQEVLRRVERREAKNPFDFFERIFR